MSELQSQDFGAANLVPAPVAPVEVMSPAAETQPSAPLHAVSFDGDFFAAFQEDVDNAVADVEAMQARVNAVIATADGKEFSVVSQQAMFATLWSALRVAQPADHVDTRTNAAERRRDDERA